MANPLQRGVLQETIDAFYANGLSLSAAATALRMSRSTLQNRLMRARKAGVEPSPHAVNEGDPTLRAEQNIQKLKDENRDLRKQLNDIHRDNISADGIREFIAGVRDALPEPPKWLLSTEDIGGAGIPVAVFSDWHVGEVVSKDQVGGVNEFNLEIAEKRVRTLVSKIVHLAFNHTVSPDYPGIVVCLGGDIISGNIHAELVEGMEGVFTQQIKEAYRLLAWSIQELHSRFGKVFIPAVVGNHGRLHHKPRAKNRAQDSFEYMIYHFLEAHFRDNNDIVFFIPDQTDARFNVGNHRFLLTHGDSTGAKGGDGVIGAIGPIIRGEKKVREVAGFSGDGYDTAIMGHYHQFFLAGESGVIVNSTLKGYDEYARNVLRARPERPNQTLLFVHPEHGIIDVRQVWLESKNAKPAKKWVAVFK